MRQGLLCINSHVGLDKRGKLDQPLVQKPWFRLRIATAKPSEKWCNYGLGTRLKILEERQGTVDLQDNKEEPCTTSLNIFEF